MSRANEAEADEPTEKTKPDIVKEELSIAEQVLESLSESDVEDMSDEQIVEIRSIIKNLEDKTEDVRKDVFDDELRNRVDVGESILGLKRVESHTKILKEDDGEVVARAVSKGIDYTEFVSVNASTVANEYPELADVEERTYDYFM